LKLHPRFRLVLILVFSTLVLDQIVKFWARAAASGVEGRSILALWPGVFELKLVFNEGVAFGMGQGFGVYLTPIAFLIAAGGLWYSWKHPSEPVSVHVTAGLLASGALGNLYDRLVLGHVTDMFWIRIINFPVFNVADMCITFAGVMLVLAALGEMLHGKKHEEIGSRDEEKPEIPG